LRSQRRPPSSSPFEVARPCAGRTAPSARAARRRRTKQPHPLRVGRALLGLLCSCQCSELSLCSRETEWRSPPPGGTKPVLTTIVAGPPPRRRALVRSPPRLRGAGRRAVPPDVVPGTRPRGCHGVKRGTTREAVVGLGPSRAA